MRSQGFLVNEIICISSMATRGVLADLANAHQQRTGCRVVLISVGGVEAAQRVRSGDVVDVVVLASNVMEELQAEGHIADGTRSDFARSEMAVAVRAGAPRMSLASETAVKEAMLAAAKVCYSTGPSGDHFRRLLERWGIADLMAPRLVQAPPGTPVGAILARGDADLGLQQFSELLHVPGIEILAPLPPEIQAVTIFTAGIGATSSRHVEANAFMAYASSHDADAVKRMHGMTPHSYVGVAPSAFVRIGVT
jgi:molybdate transport system substrate-binding protein